MHRLVSSCQGRHTERRSQTAAFAATGRPPSISCGIQLSADWTNSDSDGVTLSSSSLLSRISWIRGSSRTCWSADALSNLPGLLWPVVRFSSLCLTSRVDRVRRVGVIFEISIFLNFITFMICSHLNQKKRINLMCFTGGKKLPVSHFTCV